MASAEEFKKAVTQAYGYYKQFDFAKATHTILYSDRITEKLVRVKIRWNFYDSKDAFLTDSDYEYLLREETTAYKVYVVVSINEQQKFQELVRKKQASNEPS